MKDFVLAAACVNDGNRAALRMALLPFHSGELAERGRDTRVKILNAGTDGFVVVDGLQLVPVR